jgi:hypothetical protein
LIRIEKKIAKNEKMAKQGDKELLRGLELLKELESFYGTRKKCAGF